MNKDKHILIDIDNIQLTVVNINKGNVEEFFEMESHFVSFTLISYIYY